ncbi:NADP-dependent dehydrogenase, partial [Pasteurella multocida subsp. multocida str. Anand1_buffalo]
NKPEHVNINRIEVMPTAQSSAPLNVVKQTK